MQRTGQNQKVRRRRRMQNQKAAMQNQKAAMQNQKGVMRPAGRSRMMARRNRITSVISQNRLACCLEDNPNRWWNARLFCRYGGT